ncbi:MAG: restriction endonuclease subunit S [Sulfurimonas sp.]|jgi:type I restriction enzyme S subunit
MSEVLKVPEGWEEESFSKIAHVNMGQSPDSEYVNDKQDGIPFLQGNGEFGDINPKELFWVTKPRKLARKNDILISVRAPVGDINIADKDYCIGRGLSSLTINKIDPSYGFYALFQERKQLDRLAQGSTFSAIGKNDFDKLRIKFPKEKKEQQKIAKILSTLDKTIETTAKLIDKEKNIKKGLMHDLLTNGIDSNNKIRTPQTHSYKQSELGLIPAEWEAVSLAEISIKMTNGFVGVASPFYVEDKGVMYLYGNNIRPNKIELTKVQFIDEKFHSGQKKSQLKQLDMLTVQSGHIGTTAIVPENFGEANCHALIITRFKPNTVIPQFVSYLINSELGMNQMKTFFVGSTIMHINVADFKKYLIFLPSIKEQKQIVKILKTQDKKIQTDETNLAKLKELKKGLMNDLLAGKVRVKV